MKKIYPPAQIQINTKYDNNIDEIFKDSKLFVLTPNKSNKDKIIIQNRKISLSKLADYLLYKYNSIEQNLSEEKYIKGYLFELLKKNRFDDSIEAVGYAFDTIFNTT